jgi:hypothetical protein
MKSIITAAFLFAFSCTAFADMKASNRTTLAGQTFNNAVLVKAGKIRAETPAVTGFSLVTIQDCTTHHFVEVNERTHSFMSKDLSEASSATSDASGVAVSVSEKDTGERKTFFGYTARHIKGTITTEGSGACKSNLNATTDGWYVDLPDMQVCQPKYDQNFRSGMERGGCSDNVTVKFSGVERLGFPVVLDTTVDNKGTPMTIHQETTDISTAPLDSSLFEVPPGYKKVNTYQELMGFGVPPAQGASASGQYSGIGSPAPVNPAAASVAPSPAKKLRVGVAQIMSAVSTSLETDGWQQQLVNDLGFLGAQGVILNSDANDREATMAEAKDKNCDYAVFTTVTNFKSASVGEKIGSVLNRGSLGAIGGSGQGRVEISAAVRVFQPDNVIPIVDATSDFRQNDSTATATGLLHTEAREVMLQLRKLQTAK